MGFPLSEEQMVRQVRRAKRFNDTAFIVTVILALTVAAALLIFRWKYTFSPRRWLTSSENRGNMVNDLLREYELYGMSRKEVTDLLGYGQHKWRAAENNQLTYHLGTVTNPLGNKWLILEFTDEMVTNYSIQIS